MTSESDKRAFLRSAFVASALVTEMPSGAQLSARTMELGLGGCYIDVLNPFPEGTLVHLRILRDQEVFETKAKVIYCHPKCGMGIAFAGITPEQQSLLEAWLAKFGTQFRPVW
jgi:hypothetical protein